MGRCRVVQPEMVRLELSDGDWLDVKKDLSHGDRKAGGKSVITEVKADGWMRTDFDAATYAQIVAYVVDWSLVDPAGNKLPVSTPQQIIASLETVDEDTVDEISEVLDKHAKARKAAREEAKKLKAGTLATVAT